MAPVMIPWGFISSFLPKEDTTAGTKIIIHKCVYHFKVAFGSNVPLETLVFSNPAKCAWFWDAQDLAAARS